MQTSRFQLGLIATLAVGLGFSLSSSEAVGYPTGPTVSFGANPVVSVGGSVRSGASAGIITAPATQDLILNDVVLASYTIGSCKMSHRAYLTIDGAVVGDFEISSAFGGQGYNDSTTDGGSMVSQSLNAGIRVPAGQVLRVEVSETWRYSRYGECGATLGGIRYMLSGYYAQP